MDDHSLILNNPGLQNNRFLQEFLFTPFGISPGKDVNSRMLSQSVQYYRPLTSLSFYLDYQIWGFNPSGFHITNIIIHLINLLLIYWLLLYIGFSSFQSYLGVLLFSTIPFHFENVAWISGRTDLISFLFAALSIYCFVNFYKKNRYSALWPSAIFYFLSLLAKENTILLPLLFFGILLIRRKKYHYYIRALFPFFIGFLAWFALRLIALNSIGVPASGHGFMDLLAALGFYVTRMFSPFFLPVTVDSFAVFASIGFKIVGMAVVVGFILSLFALFKQKIDLTHPLLFLYCFCVLILPSVLIILSSSTFSLLGWRFLYLPAALFCATLVFYLQKLIKMPLVRVGIVVGLGILFAFELSQKAQLFGQKQKDFWLNMKPLQRESILVRYNSGIYLLAEHEREGEAVFQQILTEKEHPFYAIYKLKVLEALGRHYTRKGQMKKAGECFNRILREEKAFPLSFWFSYANFLALDGQQSEAERIILNQLRDFPENHLVLLHAARFYLIIKDYDRARQLLEKDYRLFPNQQTRQLLENVKKRTTRIPLLQR